jgi:tetratricopeptide (TPR) repeat protein
MSSSAQLRTVHQQGKQALRAGNLQQALSLLQQASAKTSARENEYRPVLEDMRATLSRMGRPRHALTIDWYLGDNRAASAILESVPPVDQARTLEAWAASASDGSDYHLRAADIYESAGQVARAAIARERGGDYRGARTLFSRLGDSLVREGSDRYAAALARFNLARCCRKTDDARAARAAVVSSVHLLEEAADRYERIGQRERAFDCYQVLIAIGKQSGEFEHVLEGYVNVVRILREDNLRYYALQSYEDALGEADKNREFSAGATLAQEMAAYAFNEGMTSLANHAIHQQARLWRQVAHAVVERAGPPEMAENAMLAAIVALARQHQFATVGELYRALSQIDLEPARKQHYARAAKRYAGEANAAIEAGALPAHLRQDAAFPDVWHVDLIEWEQRGSAADACGDVVLESEAWSEVTRRRAMLARMAALDLEGAGPQAPAGAMVALAKLLGQVELYTILAPLEHLFTSPLAEVRFAVVDALERFMYKRTFVTVRSALGDPDAAVRKRAYQTVEALRFPHAFDPLARIFRESDDPNARAAALRAIARIDTSEAAELLVGVFQHEGKLERAAATEALKPPARGRQFLEVARHVFPSLGKGAQKSVREIFQARGEAPPG